MSGWRARAAQELVRAARVLAGRRYFRGRDRATALMLRSSERLGGPVVLDLDGLPLELDLSDNLSRGLLLSHRAPDAWLLLARQCRLGDVVVDVGANLGYVALAAARTVGPRGHVLALEPASMSFELLRRNVLRSGLDHVTPLRLVADEADGVVDFAVANISQEYSSLLPGAIPGGWHSESVVARSLRSVLAELGLRPDVVKVDVEGAEWRVLRGLLPEHRPRCLVVEVSGANAHQFGYAPSEMCDWLSGFGYRLQLAVAGHTMTYSAEAADQLRVGDLVATRAG